MQYNYNNQANDVLLSVTPQAWAEMTGYVRLCSTEISGFGMIEPIDGIATITQVEILKQSCTTVETEIDPEALASFFADKVQKGENWAFHWHSHPSASNNPSGTDDTLYKQLRASFSILRAGIFAKGATDFKVWTMFDSPIPATLAHGITHIMVDGVGQIAITSLRELNLVAVACGASVNEATIKADIAQLVSRPVKQAQIITVPQSQLFPNPYGKGQKANKKAKKLRRWNEIQTDAEWEEYLAQCQEATDLVHDIGHYGY